MRWSPEEVAAITGGELRQRVERPIHTAFIDSRAPVAGGLFVPIVAARDGHEFIPAAIAGGASAVLQGRGRPCCAGASVIEVDDPLRALEALARDARDRNPGPVVAITGSNGKTTTRAMVAAVLGVGYAPLLCTRGNLNNHLGVPLTLVADPDEPRAMVIELGMSAPGENDHLASIVRPTHALVTSIALEHLEFMGSLEAIARAECEPIAHICAGGALIYPDDEPLVVAEIPAIDPPLLRPFGASEAATVAVLGARVGERTEAILEIRHDDGRREIVRPRLQIFGAHNARNAAAALAVGVDLGLEVAAMVAALEAVEPVGDRGRLLRVGAHQVIADCYNANPGSVAAALRSLAGLRGEVPGKLVAVLGDMLELGPTEDQLHADAGALAAELGIDGVIAVGARSRHLAAAAAGGGIAAGHFAADAAPAAIADALRELLGDEGGAVLVKGSRGMRLERVVAALQG
ncbi:MAG: UDP-N-acetylmuramoyl-tripeptide--D-alanyl-D-alanine ligase [Myxococcales bacterium]|nr:UDP-N-acetylmuramoyl-tripeptide--D-alanyl-D-alanine ligase [Myxococcales bacterium]